MGRIEREVERARQDAAREAPTGTRSQGARRRAHRTAEGHTAMTMTSQKGTPMTDLQFRWHGPMGKGYMRSLREFKRAEAEERNSRTLPSRTKRARLASVTPKERRPRRARVQ